MKQQVPIYILAASILISAILLCMFLPRSPAPAAGAAVQTVDPVLEYRRAKLNEVNDKVLRREIVEEDYLYYLSDSESLCQAIRDYNSATANRSLSAASNATGVAQALMYEHKENPGDYEQSALYYDWIGRITHHSLYSNADELCQNDPLLAYPLAKEAGGSYGMWHSRINHRDTFPGGPSDKDADEYFEQIKALLVQLEDYRASF